MRLRKFPQSAVASMCLLMTVLAPHLHSQSLADAARAEEARRKTIRNPSKVYTNKDLVAVPAPSAPPATTAASDPAAKGSAGTQLADDREHGDAASTSVFPEPDKAQARDQAYWSRRVKELQAQLDRDRTLVDALQSRIDALTTDFSARDDPVQRSLIGMDRQKALDELDRMKKSVARDQKAIADFNEEARRASVPPGWLR